MFKFLVTFCLLLGIALAADNSSLTDLGDRAIEVMLSTPEPELLQNHSFVNDFYDVLHLPISWRSFAVPRELSGRHDNLSLDGSFSLAHVALALRKHKLFATIVAVCAKAQKDHPECVDPLPGDLPREMAAPVPEEWYPQNYVERLYCAIAINGNVLPRLPLLALPSITGDVTGIRSVVAHGHRVALPDALHAKYDALSLAAALGTPTVVAALLAPPLNAPITHTDRHHLSSGEHPALLAAAEGRTAALRELFKAGVDPDIQAIGRGDTPLIAAAQRGYLKMVKMLVEEFDATIDLANEKDQHNAYTIAEHFEQTAVVAYLKRVYKARGLPLPAPLDDDSIMQDSVFRDHSAMMLRRRRRAAAAAAEAGAEGPDYAAEDKTTAEAAAAEAAAAAAEIGGGASKSEDDADGGDDDDEPCTGPNCSRLATQNVGIPVPPLPARTPASERRALLSRVTALHVRRAEAIKYQRLVEESDARFHDEVARGLRSPDEPIPTPMPDGLALTEQEMAAVLESGPVKELRERIQAMDALEKVTGAAPTVLLDGMDIAQHLPSDGKGNALGSSSGGVYGEDGHLKPGIVNTEEFLRAVGCANEAGSKCSKEKARRMLAKERAKRAEMLAEALPEPVVEVNAASSSSSSNNVAGSDKDEL